MGADANSGAAPPGAKGSVNDEASAGTMPTPPASVSSAAVEEAQALRITHCFVPSRVWCIGHTCPGATPGQQASSPEATTSTGPRYTASGPTTTLASRQHTQAHAIARNIGLMTELPAILSASAPFDD
jgi:hypothetical protein